MRRVVLGAVLLVTWLGASPVSALCYECKQSGVVCIGDMCYPVYSCRTISTLCWECWQNCYETTDQGCWVSAYCQFASTSPEEKPGRAGEAPASWAPAAP